MKKHVRAVLFVISLLLMFFAYGCAASNLESMKPSSMVTKDFEQAKINKEYNYYYGGADAYPTIIFALKKIYILEGEEDLWRKMEVIPNNLAFLVFNMQTRGMESGCGRPQGFDIFDNNGKKIGVWFSVTAFSGAPIIFKKDNKVVVYPPRDTDELKSYEGRTFSGGGH
jgi:hypothetical protein